MRNLELRDYQKNISDNIRNTEKEKNVVAIAPGGGKTETSVQIISDYLEDNPNDRVLVLTHSTTVLLNNFHERIEEINVNFTYSTDISEDVQVHLMIPQNYKKIIGEYGLLIVDEAHENYLAPTVQTIIETIKPNKQVLLTGSPSKFIGKPDYNIQFVSTNEISDEYFSKLQIELVASDYDWMDNYNDDNEVKEGFIYTKDSTYNSLSYVMEKLIQRLKHSLPAEEVNNPTFITKLKKWSSVYKQLGKTLIYTKRVEQADIIYDLLKDKGVNVIKSHSKCDDDSDNIVKFKNNEYNVLVVVNRAKLGYSDDDLMNIIDMSGTHNIDMIYQIFSRVLRGGPEMNKYYLKITPKKLENMALTHICTCGALMLTDREYVSKYNGKNFNTFTIPVKKSITIDKDYSKPKTEKDITKTIKDNNEIRLPEFSMDVVDTFKNIIYDLNKEVSIYKKTTMDDVRYSFNYSKKRKSRYTLEEIIETAMS
tara:strand:- start:571 stop:2010 length:1440 start_codon:yes stop_codon:yes gene_type:complete